MSNILTIDILLTNFLNNLFPHNNFFNYFFSFFSLRGNALLVWILVIIIALILEERKNPGISKKDKQFAVLFSLAFLLTALIVEFPLKNLFHRFRPTISNINITQPISCPKDFSFPSGHASTAFAAATVLSFFHKKKKWFYYSIAILITYSRIFLGCHFLSDVLIGAFIGYLLSKLLISLIKT